jgi:glycosyltransferase involved in cell wall biosynthesis
VRILVYPNSLNVGGSINAVELAAAVRDRGHDVTMLARPGPLLAAVQRSGLDYVPLDPNLRRPSQRVAFQVTDLVRQRGIDVVHAYEWPAAVEACAGPRLWLRRPTVCTIYSALVAPFLPRSLPLIVGAQETRDRAVHAGHSSVMIIEPPVDTLANAPGLAPGPFRAEFGFGAVPLLVVVGRLAREAKLEGLLAACDAVGRLAVSGRKAQLAVVGDGPARPEVEAAAAAANALAGSRAVVLTGQLLDPRPAYAAADVVLGMGGSALRGMALGKPLIVQGERGFWRLLTPESAPAFLYHGWYGLGSDTDGRGAGASRLAEILRGLLDEPDSWSGLGAYGRSLVVSRFSLPQAAVAAENAYAAAVRGRPAGARVVADAATAWTGALRHQVKRKWRRRRGKPVPTDDFNAIAADPQCWRGIR